MLSVIPETLEDKIFASETQKFYYRKADSPLSIKYVIDGSEKYILNNASPFSVSKGNFLIVNEHEAVESITDLVSTKAYSIFFSNKLMNSIQQVETGEPLDTEIKEHKAEHFFVPNVRRVVSNRLGEYLEHLKHTIQQCPDGDDLLYEQLLCGLARELFFHGREEEGRMKRVCAVKESTRVEIYTRISRGIDFIHDNFDRSISLEEIANFSNLSKYHFLRSFKASIKISPYKYLQNLRLEKSKEMLVSGYSSSQVASMLKFNDLSYFSNEFAKYFGYRPSILVKSANA